jgi:hypothetical protein
MNQEFWKWLDIRRMMKVFFRLESPSPIKENNILEKQRIDYIDSWFRSIVGQEPQSNSQEIWLSFSPTQIESAPDSLVQYPICSKVLYFIP